MSVIIEEPGMIFGEYEENKVFHIEKSALYKSLGKSINTVEFILYNDPKNIFIIEAKSSSPKPDNHEDFKSFITEIHNKFVHSIDIFFALILRRLEDINKEMPESFKTIDYTIINIKFLLIINGHGKNDLWPIRDALKKVLYRQIKTWRIDITVINNIQARDMGLLLEGTSK
jgi:hypothetical protein